MKNAHYRNVWHRAAILATLALLAAGCASPSSGNRESTTAASAAPSRTLVMVINTEVSSLSPKVTQPTAPYRTTRLFNAELTHLDAQGNVHPYLAEAVPQLNSDSWQVLPDGRMETTWRLRPGLTWHDGQPLTADDFVFAFQVYTADLAGFFMPKPQDVIDRVTARDDRTVTISWRSPFLHDGLGLSPLPRAVLGSAFAALEADPVGQRDVFTSLPYWLTDYVGAGPFKLVNYEPASHFEGVAFDGHALGKPRIDRMILRPINNEPTVLANIIAGEVHLTMAQALRFEDAYILQHQNGFNDAEKKGTALIFPTSITMATFQLRPEYLETRGLLDVRVRRAMHHTVDTEGINEGIYRGQTRVPLPVAFVFPDAPYYAEVDRAVTKYPYDPRRSEQLLVEAGYAKGGDGLFVGPTGDRFQPAVWNQGDPQHLKLAAIVDDTWQRAGIDAQTLAMSNALRRDNQARATFPGMLISSIGAEEVAVFNALVSEQIAAPANRWNSANKGGWSNAGFDAQWDRYNKTLVQRDQVQATIEALKIQNEELPLLGFHYNLQVVSHVAGLTGPQGHANPWNVHEWAWQ
jgi:peptide/nickel transport system substrate-binding protein